MEVGNITFNDRNARTGLYVENIRLRNERDNWKAKAIGLACELDDAEAEIRKLRRELKKGGAA